MPNKVIYLEFFIEPISHIDGPIYPYKKDEDPCKVEVTFEDGSSVITDHRRKKCTWCYVGYYLIDNDGDVDGYENKCTSCKKSVFGPIYS